MEGSTVRVLCINRNISPFTGSTFWNGPMNIAVSTGGFLNFIALRSLAGTYSCGVNLYDKTITVDIPSLKFTLVVHCKLLKCL